MENEQSSAALANPDSFLPLLDKERQFAGEYLIPENGRCFPRRIVRR